LFWKNIREKKAFEATYNGEKSRGFGKIHTKKRHSGQNTMAKNYIWGKTQLRKRKGFGTINEKNSKRQWRKQEFGAECNGEKRRGCGKIQRKNCMLG
jgi:hypothetical protein